MKEKHIQWFPGHMFKSLREIRERIALMDLVCILLDARLPASSMNPEIIRIVKDRPVLILLNKMDLADPNQTRIWKKTYENSGYFVLEIDASSGKNVAKIEKIAAGILKDKRAKTIKKGLKNKPIRTMILGIPNVGKSTLINRLVQKNATKTANRPGVTRAQQWVHINEQFELLDTPGVLWPKFDESKVGYHLAITGAIKDGILPIDEVAIYALSFLREHYPKRLFERYGMPEIMEREIDMLNWIGEMRKCYLNQHEIDYERVYHIVLTDIRKNKLGGLTFDRPLSS
jgi:ribosome biogenesis GTPase A